MTPRRDPRPHVDDVLQAIANIEADTAGLDFEQFAAGRRVRQLVERNLEIISEASRRIPDRMKATEPDVPWREIAGIGNVYAMTMARYGRKSFGESAPIASLL